jgi:prephenate dehydrogenase
MKPVIGIVGGTGRMGHFFKKFFEKQKCKVLVSGRHTKLTSEKLVKKSDIVFFCVPIHDTEKIIKKLAPLAKKKALLSDFTSLKARPLKALKKFAPKDTEVVGMHPVFGPSTKSVKDQIFIFTPARKGKWFAWLKKVLRKNKAKVKVMSAEKHDKLMSAVQALTHYDNLVFTLTLKKLGFKPEELTSVAPLTHYWRLMLACRGFNQDGEMYADLIKLNPNSKKALKAFKEASRECEKDFKKKFKATGKHFKKISKKALKQTDAFSK